MFFGESSPKCYPPTHPMVIVRFGSTKGDIRAEKGDFRGDLFFLRGFRPCLGIIHPTHPHLGEGGGVSL